MAPPMHKHACASCRAKKLRCDRQHPCGNCIARVVECRQQILPPPGNSDSKRPSAASDPLTIRTILRRLDQLETLVHEKQDNRAEGSSSVQTENLRVPALNQTPVTLVNPSPPSEASDGIQHTPDGGAFKIYGKDSILVSL